MAEKKIVELNQSAKRITEILNATDEALKVTDEQGNLIDNNLNKVWLTSVEEKENVDGSIQRISKIEPKSLSELNEYIVLSETTNQLERKINNEITGLDAQQALIAELETSVQEIWDELGSSISKIKINPITPTYHAVLLKDKNSLVINYQFESLSSGNPTGPGSVTWKINGVEVKTENNIRQNNFNNEKDYNTFDFSQYEINL